MVTGGTGFIGKNVVEHFRKSATVIAPAHKELDLKSPGEVQAFLKGHDIDYVVHCASVGVSSTGLLQSGVDEDIVGTNVMMFSNLIDNARYYKRLITFGSGAEYDKRRPIVRVTEKELGASVPSDEYGFSKYTISKFIENDDRNSICLRLFGVFGKYEDYRRRFISNAIVNNLRKLPITIRQNVCFDYLYINDLMRILPHFFDNNNTYNVYNVTTCQPTDLVSIAGIINSVSQYKSKIITERPGMGNEYTGSNLRLMSKIGDFKFTPINQAVLELMGYYKGII
jgi:GDP-L-fucose synthase